MAKEITIYSFIIFFVLSITDAMEADCSEHEDLLERCSMALPVLGAPDIAFALTRKELDESCSELRPGLKCIYYYKKLCMKKHERVVFTRIYSGMIDVIQQLCTPGKYQDKYLKHVDCIRNIKPQYDICSSKYEVILTQLNNKQSDQYQTVLSSGVIKDDMYLKTVCSSFQEFLTCSEQTVQRSCGDEAAKSTNTFIKRMASNILRNFCLK